MTQVMRSFLSGSLSARLCNMRIIDCPRRSTLRQSAYTLRVILVQYNQIRRRVSGKRTGRRDCLASIHGGPIRALLFQVMA